jgi:hypothetical protein
MLGDAQRGIALAKSMPEPFREQVSARFAKLRSLLRWLLRSRGKRLDLSDQRIGNGHAC